MSDSTQPHVPAPFDERAALAELERLADKIQLFRQQREKAVAEFDAFVNGFRYDRYTSSIAATDRELRRAEDRVPVAATAATHAARATTPSAVAPVATPPAISAISASGAAPTPQAAVLAPETPPTAVTALETVAPAKDTSPWGASAEREAITQAPGNLPRIRAANVGVGLATLAVLAVAVLLWRSSSGPVGPATPTNPPAVPASGSATPAATQEAALAPKPTIPAGPPRALNIEFITTRPVWARITVDGRKVAEKEFPGDQRIPLGADKGILIRAGDAGAIRLVVDGKDLGPLGKDGQIFSRAFVPAAK